jgi:hypothetical protein
MFDYIKVNNVCADIIINTILPIRMDVVELYNLIFVIPLI